LEQTHKDKRDTTPKIKNSGWAKHVFFSNLAICLVALEMTQQNDRGRRRGEHMVILMYPKHDEELFANNHPSNDPDNYRDGYKL